jgi:DNA-binding GntR family transcriptional regulator
VLIRLWPVTEAHVTIALARDQATRDDPRRAHDVPRLLVDAIVERDLDKVHEALIVHPIDSARRSRRDPDGRRPRRPRVGRKAWSGVIVVPLL